MNKELWLLLLIKETPAASLGKCHVILACNLKKKSHQKETLHHPFGFIANSCKWKEEILYISNWKKQVHPPAAQKPIHESIVFIIIITTITTIVLASSDALLHQTKEVRRSPVFTQIGRCFPGGTNRTPTVVPPPSNWHSMPAVSEHADFVLLSELIDINSPHLHESI